MTLDPDAVADELGMGDTAETNRIIDAIDELETSERYRLYHDLLSACRPVFADAEDGYVRQSVVRALREAYPGVERTPGGVSELNVDNASRTAVAAQRGRHVAFLLDALDDPDGRVRVAAADAFDLLAVGLGMADLVDERDRIAADLESLATNQPEAKRTHTEQAREALEHLGVAGMFADALPKENDEEADDAGVDG